MTRAGIWIAALGWLWLGLQPALADDDDLPAPTAPAASSHSLASLFAPEFRVEGTISAMTADDNERLGENGNRFSVSEAGISMRSYVDPYFSFEIELAGGDALEDGQVQSEFGFKRAFAVYLRDENGIWARIGKMPTSFGEYNDGDPDELAEVTAPDVVLNYFGEDDGYIDTGIEANVNVPIFDTSHIFWLGILNGDNPVVFHGGAERKPIYFARYEFFFDFGPLTGFEVTTAYIQGLNRRETEVNGEPFTVRGETRMANLHMDVDHQPARTYLYSGWTLIGELFWQQRDYEKNDALEAAAAAEGLDIADLDHKDDTWGFYLLGEIKLGRNWRAGLRADRSPVRLVEFSEEPSGESGDSAGVPSQPYRIFGGDPVEAGSLILSYHPSRFTTIRGQYTNKRIGGDNWNEVWIQLQVLIGFERPDVF